MTYGPIRAGGVKITKDRTGKVVGWGDADGNASRFLLYGEYPAAPEQISWLQPSPQESWTVADWREFNQAAHTVDVDGEHPRSPMPHDGASFRYIKTLEVAQSGLPSSDTAAIALIPTTYPRMPANPLSGHVLGVQSSNQIWAIGAEGPMMLWTGTRPAWSAAGAYACGLAGPNGLAEMWFFIEPTLRLGSPIAGGVRRTVHIDKDQSTPPTAMRTLRALLDFVRPRWTTSSVFVAVAVSSEAYDTPVGYDAQA